MTEPAKAVFLSYASQDAEAAQRICDSLRAAGIEVWFDQSELQGGDVWDASIKKQIKTCALFIPVISRNTHAREEGYFRLEWKLAVDRSHLMTASKTFLLPAVIDDTRDDDEQVPEKFREIQWTRLPGGETPPAFVERIAALLELVGQAHDSTRVAPAVEAGTTQPPSRASIGVLPFASLSSDPEKDYFGDGIAEELIHLLTRVPGLKVPARTSSFAYKGRNTDVRQIARELGVGMLLEGSVRSSGDRIRITAELIEAESGFHLWSQTYDRRFADIFQLQDELSGAIVQALKINLGGRVPARLRDAPPTKNVEAYRLWLQARAQRKGGLGLDHALALSKESIALDPGFARAHAELAVTCTFLFTFGFLGPEILVEAQRAAEQALRLDPDSTEAHAIMGLQHAVRGQWLSADQSFRRALELDPMEPLTRTAYAASVLSPTGKRSEGLTHAVRGYELAPAVGDSAVVLAGLCLLNNRDEDARRYVQVGRDLGATAFPLLLWFSSEIARHAGQYTAAAEHVITALPKRLRTKGIEDVVREVYDALADVRLAPRAVAAVKSLRTQANVSALETFPMSMLTLYWYALLGAWDDGYDTWQRMVQTLKRAGVLNSIEFVPIWMPELRDFRRDPRFQDIVRELGLIEYWRERGPPDQCTLEGDRLIVL